MNHQQNPSSELIDSIKTSTLSTILADVSEATFDSMLNDGILKEIPVIHTIINLAQTGINISQKLFLKKITRFLDPIAQCSGEERATFTAQLENDAGTKIKAGEAILLTLDRLDHMEKATLLGNLYVNYMHGRISYSELMRFTMILDRSLFDDVIELSKISPNKEFCLESSPHFLSQGVVVVVSQDWGSFSDDHDGATFRYKLTPQGKKFFKNIFLARS